MQAWARLIRKRGFNMAGKENQWDLRVEYGWGRCVHTYTQTHTRRLTQAHGAMHACSTHMQSHMSLHTHTHTPHQQHHIGTCTGNYLQ